MSDQPGEIDPVSADAEPPKLTQRELAVAGIVTLVMFIFLAVFTHEGVFMAGNDASKFAHIEAVVDHGKPHVELSRYRWTIDKIEIDGHYYSNKPPTLALIGSVCYAWIQQVTGWTFVTDSMALTKWITVLLVGLPTSLLIGVFYLAIVRHERTDPLACWLAVGGLALGTILTSYSVTFNNHTNAALFLFLAVWLTWRNRFAASGLCIGLTTMIDVLPGLFFIPWLGWMAVQHGQSRGLLRFLAVGSVCAVLFFLANLITVGSPLLPKLVAGGVDQSSNFGSSVGGVLLPEKWYYPLECLFAGHGFFAVSPILLLGLWGLIHSIRNPETRRRKGLLFFSVSLALFVVGHICLAGSYGGWAYGFRYLIPIIPLLMFFIPVVLKGKRRYIYSGLLAISILFTVIGMDNPWPPCFEQERNADPVASSVTNPIGGNASAWLNRNYPSSAFSHWMARTFVSENEGEQRAYFRCYEDSKGIR